MSDKTKSSNNLLNIPDGSPLISAPGQPFEYIWVIDNWINQTVDPISQNFVINNLSFHMQACRPKQPSQFLSVKVILVEKPPGPKTFRFNVEIVNHLFPEKSIVKRSSKAFSRMNAYESFTLLSSSKITEKDGFLSNGSLTIIFRYSPNSINQRRTDSISSSNSNIQIQDQSSKVIESQIPPKSNSMVFTPSTSIIPVVSKYSGLKNQGATCYMNSILQVLYHIPSFRRIVYSMPTTGNEDISTSIPLNLQSLFCRMQFTKTSCSTTDLTRSFGWDRSYTSRQHDVVEFERELIQNLETKLKDTELAGHFLSLITGKMRTCIKCKNVDFIHSIDEDFDSLSLIVRGCANIDESLKKELEIQELTGSEQYKTDEYGLQDAIMKTEFVNFPPILMIQLQRFEHDFSNNRNIKINDRFEYKKEIDLTSYLADNSEQLKRNNTYLLFAVIVHSGSIASGHYYAYIRPSFDDDQWYKFDDTNITIADEYDVINDNFGGYVSTKEKNYSAYLLIYVRKEDIHSLFEPITDESVPVHIRESTVQIDMKKKSEVPPDYIDIRLDSETSIKINSMRWLTGFHNNSVAFVFRIDSDEKVIKLYEKVAELMKKPMDQLRLWKCSTYSIPEEPILIDNENQKLSEILGKNANVFVQKISPENGEKVAVEKDCRVIFFKFFFLPKSNPSQNVELENKNEEDKTKSNVENLTLKSDGGFQTTSSIQSSNFDIRFEATIRYIGARTVKREMFVSDLFPIVNERVGLPIDTPLTVFEETVQHTAQLLSNPSTTTTNEVGRLLIFQVSPGIEITGPDPTLFDTFDGSEIPLQSISSSGFFDPQWSNLPIVSYYLLHPDLAPTTIDQYMNHKLRTLESVMFDYDDETRTGISIVRFPANLSWPALKRLISIAVSRDYEPENDSMRIYKRNPSTGGPSKFPISMKFSHSIASSLIGSMPKRGDRLHLFFSIIHGIPESMLVNMANYDVQYSEDGFSVSRSARLLIEKNSSLRKVAFEMQNRGILPVSDSIRVLQVVDRRIVQFFERPDDQIVNNSNTILRFENVPIEQRNFDDKVNVYVPVSHGYIDSYDKPHFVVDPFLYMCSLDEKLIDIREPLLKWAEVPDSQSDVTVIMKLHCKDKNYNDEGFVVNTIKNDVVVSSIVNDGDQLFIWNPELEKMKEEVYHVTFVDHPPPRKNENESGSKKREIEQPVKIFN